MDRGYRLAGNRDHDAFCKWCRKMLLIPPRTISKAKRSASRLNRRVFKKADIREQLEDHEFGIDPDMYGLGNWVYL